jgi:hypothetical protein
MRKKVLMRYRSRTAVLARERGPENAGAAAALPQRQPTACASIPHRNTFPPRICGTEPP